MLVRDGGRAGGAAGRVRGFISLSRVRGLETDNRGERGCCDLRNYGFPVKSGIPSCSAEMALNTECWINASR